MAAERSGRKLFIYGVDQNLTDIDIKEHLDFFGKVLHVYNTGKGYAFLTFAEKDAADLALIEMDGYCLLGRKISVERAKVKRKKKPQRERAVFTNGRPAGWSDMDTDEELDYLSSI